jgi:hypothetical protein
MSFIFNRRHLINNGMISIIITSQKFNFVPTVIRSNITFLITFKLNKSDFKTIEDSIIYNDVNFDDITSYVFKNNNNNFLMYRIDIDQFYINFDKLNI